MNIKKLMVILLIAGLIFNPYHNFCIAWIHAEEVIVYEPASVVTIDNLDEYDTKASVSWSCELMFPEDSETEVSAYSYFTLEKDSIVKIGGKYTAIGEWYSATPDVTIYSNEARTVEKLEVRFTSARTIYLPAGTYYMEAKDKRVVAPGVKVEISICALPVTNALSATSKLDKNKSEATVTVTQALGADLENIKYVYGAYDKKDNETYGVWGDNFTDSIELTNGNTFTVNKNGTYTIRVITKDGTSCSIQHNIEGLGNTASQSADAKYDEAGKKEEVFYVSDKDSNMNHRVVIIGVITLIMMIGGMAGFIILHCKKVRYYRELSEDYKEQFTQKYAYFKNYKKKQEDIAKFRHDWKNHMLLLQEMLNHGEYEKAKIYFRELSEKTAQNQQTILTGNEIVDLILASKTDELEDNQIKLTCNGRLDSFKSMENVDCCTLFSNLIDNAIEANLKLERGRYINITTNRTNKLLYVEISNPLENMADVIETRFQTTKKDSEKHGIGLRNVYEIFRKYHIEYYIITNEQGFSIQMLFEI